MVSWKVWLGLGATLGSVALAAVWMWNKHGAVRIPAGDGPPLTVTPGQFPHAVFDRVLKRVVNARGQVDYQGLAAKPQDLYRYLHAIATYSPQTHPELFPSQDDRLAYYINAYNAYVMLGVLNRPQMRSVNDVSVRFFGLTRYALGGQPISLYQLENEIVRKEFREPRIHFALNCASAGCPVLPQDAFVPDQLEAQLKRESEAFCRHPDKVRRQDDGRVALSQIFEWYAEDFEADGGPVAFCRKWGRSDLPADAPVTFIPYDWTLNHQPGRALWE